METNQTPENRFNNIRGITSDSLIEFVAKCDLKYPLKHQVKDEWINQRMEYVEKTLTELMPEVPREMISSEIHHLLLYYCLLDEQDDVETIPPVLTLRDDSWPVVSQMAFAYRDKKGLEMFTAPICIGQNGIYDLYDAPSTLSLDLTGHQKENKEEFEEAFKDYMKETKSSLAYIASVAFSIIAMYFPAEIAGWVKVKPESEVDLASIYLFGFIVLLGMAINTPAHIFTTRKSIAKMAKALMNKKTSSSKALRDEIDRIVGDIDYQVAEED